MIAKPLGWVNLLFAILREPSWENAALKLLPLLARLGWGGVAAWLILRTLRPMNADMSGIPVLVIEKAVFTDDVRTVLAGHRGIAPYGLKRAVLKALALGVLPRANCADDTYIFDVDGSVEAKQKYRGLCARLWRTLERHGFRGVLTGNWAYWAERELGAAMEEAGAPFIVLHKEGIKPPARSVFLQSHFRSTRGQFAGRRMLVYQDLEREHQLAGGISRPDQVRVCGMPRMDDLHAWRRQAANGQVPAAASRPLALVLPFLPDNFLPAYSGYQTDMLWTGLADGLLQAAVMFAQRNPGVDVILRPRGHEAEPIDKMLTALGYARENRPANLVMNHEGNAQDAVKQAWVVVGHNTTVLLEALAAGKPVLEPHFAEARQEAFQGYLIDLKGATARLESPDALVAAMESATRQAPTVALELSAQARYALEYWTGNGDGRAARRTYAVLCEEFGLDVEDGTQMSRSAAVAG